MPNAQEADGSQTQYGCSDKEIDLNPNSEVV
jgi:hypothetical protein